MSISIADSTERALSSDPHYEDRCDLAAAFRMSARLGMDEAVGNHFSYAVSEDGSRFLVNPFGRHFSSLRASDLLLLDANSDRAEKADPTAWAIHGAMHRNLPRARCVMHAHSKYATVLMIAVSKGKVYGVAIGSTMLTRNSPTGVNWIRPATPAYKW